MVPGADLSVAIAEVRLEVAVFDSRSQSPCSDWRSPTPTRRPTPRWPIRVGFKKQCLDRNRRRAPIPARNLDRRGRFRRPKVAAAGAGPVDKSCERVEIRVCKQPADAQNLDRRRHGGLAMCDPWIRNPFALRASHGVRVQYLERRRYGGQASGDPHVQAASPRSEPRTLRGRLRRTRKDARPTSQRGVCQWARPRTSRRVRLSLPDR